MTFSQDTSLMAAGFAESYIKIWSLKGEKLRGMRSDFTSSGIKDRALFSQTTHLPTSEVRRSELSPKDQGEEGLYNTKAYRP